MGEIESGLCSNSQAQQGPRDGTGWSKILMDGLPRSWQTLKTLTNLVGNIDAHATLHYDALLRSWIPPGATGAVIKVQKIEKPERGTRTFSAFQQHSHVGPRIVIVRLCSRTEVTQLSTELGGMAWVWAARPKEESSPFMKPLDGHASCYHWFELQLLGCSASTKTVPGMANITATAGERTALAAVEPPTYPLDLMRRTIGFSLRVSLLYGFGEPDRHSWCTIGIAICDVSRSRFMTKCS
uniref:Uncharacterized protein B24P11.090 n=1 Tax=Neurospora crassa TaxID=5141 RepID=Q96U54_NEUCS|nr:hypothetical protein [Neurospora crassa]